MYELCLPVLSVQTQDQHWNANPTDNNTIHTKVEILHKQLCIPPFNSDAPHTGADFKPFTIPFPLLPASKG